MERRLQEIQKAHDVAYSEKVNRQDYTLTEHKKPTKFTIPGDDATFQPKMWASLMTDCAFYFDRPTLE